jgi:exopolyphosphatase / guanosine-5'-triphosphate,3'-diphosphate pyrophosphatase
MRVALIDVGSNTARLLVADVDRGAVTPVDEERAYLQLGAEPGIGELAIEKAAATARRFAARAAAHSPVTAEAIVTAPGRQPEAAALLDALRGATHWPVRVLSAEEEGKLAFDGAVSRADPLPEVVGVVDVGGGSSELAVGTPLLGAAWVRSLPTGSLRLRTKWLRDDPPSAAQLTAARDAVRSLLEDVDPPLPDGVLATGGTARALVRVAGRRYDALRLEQAVANLAGHRSDEIVRAFGIHPRRAATIVGGAIVLAELARLLDRPLDVSRGGLREGAALTLAAGAAAVAA